MVSRQIRPPIYSLKQTKLRKRRVVRYAMLYFFLLLIFVLTIAGPLVASKFLKDLPVSSIPMDLYQPTGLNNNDTKGTSETGTGAAGGAAATGDAASTSGSAKRLMLARAY